MRSASPDLRKHKKVNSGNNAGKSFSKSMQGLHVSESVAYYLTDTCIVFYDTAEVTGDLEPLCQRNFDTLK